MLVQEEVAEKVAIVGHYYFSVESSFLGEMLYRGHKEQNVFGNYKESRTQGANGQICSEYEKSIETDELRNEFKMIY